jgi:hypothetical protein
MKNTLIVIGAVLTFGFNSFAQTNFPVKGTIDIKFNTRQTEKPPARGVKDVYTVAVNVANSALFQGTIQDQPQIIDGWVSKSVVQPRVLIYDINCDVVNPKNPAQTKNVGRMIGNVPISSEGVYQYDRGNLEVAIFPMGNAGGFTSKFSGSAEGKPLARPANWLETLQRNAVSITRSVNGKTTTVVLKKYDKMEFKNHVVAAGPVAIYQTVTLNGEMLYDYDKECWFFNNVTMQYAENNMIKIDRLTGTIRWDKKANEYQFDVRVNEPPPSATAAFETNASDESSFFETDTKVPALVGTWEYKDTKRGDTTLASAVSIDLLGNNLTKQQTMAITKALVFSAVVPMNSD